MSKFQRNLKRLTIGLGAVTVVGGIAGTGWYRTRYVLPPEPKREIELPSPNGFDTLHVAAKLEVKEKDGVAISPRSIEGKLPIQPLVGRQKLVAANLASIQKTRELLTQDYRMPLDPGSRSPYGSQAREQARMLAFASETYADSGNLPEAATCALDAIELGTKVPQGGSLIPGYVGTACEAIGQAALWKQADRLDAATVRATIARLERIDAGRWPFAETVAEEKRNLHGEWSKTFTRNPLTGWKNLNAQFNAAREFSNFVGTISSDTEPVPPPTLAERFSASASVAALLYRGPRPALLELDRSADRAIERSKLPWGTQRPKPLKLKEPLAQLLAPIFDQSEFKWMDIHTKAILLKTYLALRAYRLEKGNCPKSLDELLADGYLKSPPIDPFSPVRASLGYKPDGEKFTLWSVGPDAKNDDGKPIGGDSPRRFFENAVGDIVARVNTK